MKITLREVLSKKKKKILVLKYYSRIYDQNHFLFHSIFKLCQPQPAKRTGVTADKRADQNFNYGFLETIFFKCV